jgi:hypothetical protein
METISMSNAERKRLEVFSRVKLGILTLNQASEMLGLSYRQTKRIWSRYGVSGDAGLVHRSRGRASNRQPVATRKSQILALVREQYGDYGPTLAAECLAKEHALSVPVTTLRRWLSQAGLWERRRKRKLHRRRRPRREQHGELLQMDGSHHDWFEGRRGWAVLMVLIDDATGTVNAYFFENESWHSAAESLRRYIGQRGLPQALYVDRHGIYRAERDPTPEELLANQVPETQFGRALRELGVRLILARSPQAKGRVERMNGTLQDRLVKALRRAGIGDLARANEFLVDTFLPEFNQQFTVPATQPTDGHQPLPSTTDLSRVLSIQEERTVQNDWTVRWQNGFLQLLRATAGDLQPGQRVTVCEPLSGPLRIFAGERELRWSTARSEPSRRPSPRPSTGPTKSSQGQKPAVHHPWRGRPTPSPPPPPPAAAAAELACSAPAR